MRDKSGAQRVPAGSSRSIMLAASGSLAAQPPALGQHCPDATPLPTVSEHHRPDTMPLPTVSEHNRPDTTPSLTVSEHHRPDATPLLTVSAHHRPDATPLPTVSEHNRPDATPLPTVPEPDRPGASYAAVSVPDRSPVSPPPAAAHDCSRRVPIAAGSPSASVTHSTTQEETVYDRLFTIVALCHAVEPYRLLATAAQYLAAPPPPARGRYGLCRRGVPCGRPGRSPIRPLPAPSLRRRPQSTPSPNVGEGPGVRPARPPVATGGP